MTEQKISKLEKEILFVGDARQALIDKGHSMDEVNRMIPMHPLAMAIYEKIKG